jgi:hypothetical protein
MQNKEKELGESWNDETNLAQAEKLKLEANVFFVEK